MPKLKTNSKLWLFLGLSLLLLASGLLSLFFSGVPLDLAQAFGHPQSSDYQILWTLRLPRILLAALVGVALSSSGVAFQSLLKNPLADPYILGVSGGAALGSALALSLDLSFIWISLSGFLGSLLILSFLYSFSLVQGRLQVERLLLSGVLFNSLSFSIILLINFLVSAEKSNRILYLMVGSLGEEPYTHLAIVAALVLLGWGVLYRATP
ncbi:MAG: iron chelate uptake ABC transporter family permease subunit, partial [Deltaproteobacteria bacterium]|nr:iron chelate uptake ABC transporter family permease subunit [Deltaproteobacteria bacterium]